MKQKYLITCVGMILMATLTLIVFAQTHARPPRSLISLSASDMALTRGMDGCNQCYDDFGGDPCTYLPWPDYCDTVPVLGLEAGYQCAEEGSEMYLRSTGYVPKRNAICESDPDDTHHCYTGEAPACMLVNIFECSTTYNELTCLPTGCSRGLPIKTNVPAGTRWVGFGSGCATQTPDSSDWP